MAEMDRSGPDIDTTADTQAQDFNASAKAEGNSSVGLRPLTPSYDEEQHGQYVKELLAAVDTDGVYNIALAGRYGAGKSSVLKGFLQHLSKQQYQRTVVLSLATLDPSAPTETQISVDNQTEKDKPDLSFALTTTNRIQKELVKQLLYREQPARLPQSRFRRIRARSRLGSAAKGAALAAVLATVLILFDAVPTLAGTGPGSDQWQRLLSYGLAFGVGAAIFGLLHWSVWERFAVSSFSAGGAKIELSPQSISYFDQYLDEIIYFFEQTNTEVVIFEDIDRFEDHHIFQSLRDLNTLLNASERRQRSERRWPIWRRLRPVRFIYATRDSIFEGLNVSTPESHESMDHELARANRTKFFELIIPLVPFITPASSRGLLIKELDIAGHAEVSRYLLSLVAEKITDMRLLRNIANEYKLFHHRLFTQGKGAPGLTRNALFALIVFKNIYPSEFESTTRGAGKLVDLYNHAQCCVENDLRVLRNQRDRLRDDKEFASVTKRRARDAGQALKLHLSGRLPDTLTRDGVTWAPKSGEADLCHPEFWRSISRAQEPCIFLARSSNGQSFGPVTVALAHLRAVTGLTLETDSWDSPDQDQVTVELHYLEQLIEEAPTFDFEKLASHKNRKDPQKEDSDQVLSLSAWMKENLVGFELVADLVRAGYISKNFAAYLGEDDGSLPATVKTFIFQHVQTNTPFFDFAFGGCEESETGAFGAAASDAARNSAITALLDESDSFLSKPSAYSRELMDYLLEHKQHQRAQRLIDRLCSRTEEAENEFIRKYLQNGSHPDAFAELLSPHWPDIFVTLTEIFGTVSRGSEIDRLWTAALTAADPKMKYQLTDSVVDMVHDQYASMAAFYDPRTPEEATRIVAFLDHSDARIPELDKVSADGSLREQIIAESAYSITYRNLATAVGAESTGKAGEDGSEGTLCTNVSLDRVIEVPSVWNYCRNNPNWYLEALPETQNSMETPQAIVSVLTAIRDHWDSETVQQVLTKSAPESTLDEQKMDQVDPSYWAPLAASNRFIATTNTLSAYLAENGPAVDVSLAHLLNEQRTIILSENVDDTTKEKLGAAILAATDFLSAETRADLVASLQLGHPWRLETVPSSDSSLISPLLDRELLDNTKATFKHFLDGAGWHAVESAAAKCGEFVDYLDRDFVGDTVTDLLSSPNTLKDIRTFVLERLDEFITEDDARSLKLAATAAVTHQTPVPAASAERIARVLGEKDHRLLLQLLALATQETLDNTQLVRCLSHLPDPWRYFNSKVETEFDPPEDEDSKQMLDNLKKRGLAKQDGRRRPPVVEIL